MIWKIWKKSKLKREKIWKIWKISVLVIITPKEISSLLIRRSDSNSVEISPKTRYKEKHNETHYENITH
jgi:hypothetical protein